jgi:hypothetical protein
MPFNHECIRISQGVTNELGTTFRPFIVSRMVTEIGRLEVGFLRT